MSEEKIEKVRKEIIGIIIDLLIHDWDKNSILNVLTFNESDIACIDHKYSMTEKICINIARDLHFYDITVEELEKVTGVDKAVFKDFVRNIK